MKKSHKNNWKRRKQERIRKLAEDQKQRALEKPVESEPTVNPKSSDIENQVEWYDPDRHKHLTFMAIARVSSGQQLKNLFKQIYRIETFANQEGLDVIDRKIHWMVNSAFWSKNKRECVEIAELEGMSGPHPPFDPRRSFYKPHYEKFEWLKVKMGRYPNAAFLFESLDRAIRPDDYSFENKDVRPKEGELTEFVRVMNPYPVILMCPVDAIAKKMGEYYKKLNKGFKDSQCLQNYKEFLKCCKHYELFGMKSVDRLGIKAKYHDKIIRRFQHYLKFRKDLKLEPIYKLIFERYPEVPKSTIKLWCQDHRKKQ